ncbi:hypothetical protein GL279_00455 [Paracoccus limosus]|uniref:Uncharacterized protein n=1 Tax=Paracoccus limosus TaxID=913252 RepID=A0A844GWN9_9RHOB|nr:hypothetical protein [Paracoccus limosus]MTH33069.1 hypothetical protein [Paracoccus limosus]
MQPIITVPPLNLWTTQDARQSWRYLEAESPVDFTQTVDGAGYTAELLVLRARTVEYRARLELDADGFLSATIPAQVGQSMRSCKRIDAAYQITITAPLPDLNVVWQGPVIVQEIAA